METKQSRVLSAVEATMNTLSGFFISLAVWIWVVAPLYDIEVTYAQNFSITMIFTVSSLVRSYVVRRFFTNGWHRFATRLANKITGETA